MNKGVAGTRREQLRLRAAIDNLGDLSGRGLQEVVLALMDELLVKESVNYHNVQRMPSRSLKGCCIAIPSAFSGPFPPKPQ